MGGIQPNLDNRMDLMEFIDNHMLHDMDLKGLVYTWTNKRRGKDIIQVRLDRALIRNEWFQSYNCSLTARVKA